MIAHAREAVPDECRGIIADTDGVASVILSERESTRGRTARQPFALTLRLRVGRTMTLRLPQEHRCDDRPRAKRCRMSAAASSPEAASRRSFTHDELSQKEYRLYRYEMDGRSHSPIRDPDGRGEEFLVIYHPTSPPKAAPPRPTSASPPTGPTPPSSSR
jgi:hypothetical protein